MPLLGALFINRVVLSFNSIGLIIDFERQFYSAIEGGYVEVCVVVVSGGGLIFEDIQLDVQVDDIKQGT